MHDLDFLVDQDLGQLDGRVGHRVLDDPVRERVPRSVEGVALEATPDVLAQRVERRELAEAREEILVEVGQDGRKSDEHGTRAYADQLETGRVGEDFLCGHPAPRR